MKQSKWKEVLAAVVIILAFSALLVGSCYWTIKTLKKIKTEGNEIRMVELKRLIRKNHSGCVPKILGTEKLESIGYLSNAKVRACGSVFSYEYKTETDWLNGGTVEGGWVITGVLQSSDEKNQNNERERK